MIVLGLSAYYHDSAAALVRDGAIVAAAQEERFSRNKADAAFPKHAVAYCLDEAGLTMDDVDLVAFYDKPLLTFDRLLETYLAFAPVGLTSFKAAIPQWTKEKLFLHSTLVKEINDLERGAIDGDRIRFNFHHHSHAASAFFPSPFDEAAVVVVDAVGEWATTSYGVGKGNSLEILKEIKFPHSLGMLYSAVTHYLGFRVNDGEYKIMGLAPYGEPKYLDVIKEKLIRFHDDGSFRIAVENFNYCTGLSMTDERFERVFGQPRRKTGEAMTQFHMDVARSVQVVTEEAMLSIARQAHAETGSKNLCLAGGVALNCVANGRILREGPFENVWIQPAAGDAGGAIGSALALSAIHDVPRQRNGRDAMAGGYLGPAYSDAEVTSTLEDLGAAFHQLDDDALFDSVSEALAADNVVGWFQGRMEFGPRALGNRSILGDPRSPRMQSQMNRKIKYRESFRPFAPAVLSEDAAQYFDLDRESPYMLIVTEVAPSIRRQLSDEDQQRTGLERLGIVRSDLPAITHVDNSARVQTVHRETNPRFHRLIEAFKAKTGCSALVNTSFNVRDEPIVATPLDAYNCFMRSEMDILVIGNAVLYKHEQA